jgi:hypothetical protein
VTDPGGPGQPGGYNPYNPQGGDPYHPQGGEAPGPSPYGTPPPPAPVKKGSAGKVVGIVAGVLVGLLAICGVLGYFLWNAVQTDTVNAKVNDCINADAINSETAKEVKNTKIVKCNSPAARYKVVGVVSDKSEDEFMADDSVCKAFPDAVSQLWQGQTNKKGRVLCLADNKP